MAGIPRSWSRGDGLLALLLMLTVNAIYVPVWRAGFTWDDDYYITANHALNSWRGLRDIWTTGAADISPLTTTTFWVLHALWGTAPLAYHLANVLTHAACAVVLWRVLLGLRVPGAWFGAALWALHPVQVESVAWASELKNPESTLFFLLSILFFLRWLGPESAGQKRDWNYGLSLLFAALAMACKSSTVVLPLVLCLCGWWLEGRWQWRNLVVTAPMFFFSAIAAISSLVFEQGQFGTIVDLHWERTWPERLATAGDAIWFYLGKLVWPHPLMTIYPRWEIQAGTLGAYLPLIGVMVLAAGLWTLRNTRWRGCFFAFAYFVVALLPALGFVEHFILQYSLVFDHFQYLASMGPLALAGAGLTRLATLTMRESRTLRYALAGVALLVLGLVSWERADIYETPRKMWTDAHAKNPDSWLTNDNLGYTMLEDGDVAGAIVYQRRALELSPNSPGVYLHLGDALRAEGKLDEALAAYRRSVNLRPTFDMAYSDIGYIFLAQGRVDEAINMLIEALSIGPGRTESHERLGEAYAEKKAFDRAIYEYRFAVRLSPDYFTAHEKLGLAYAQSGRLDEAVTEFQIAAGLQPARADAWNNLANVLASEGRLDEATAAYGRAVVIDPADPRTYNNLGAVYFREGRWDDAAMQFAKELTLDPKSDMAHYCLGVVHEKKGEMTEAIDEYGKALTINPNNALARAKLAGAPGAGKR